MRASDASCQPPIRETTSSLLCARSRRSEPNSVSSRRKHTPVQVVSGLGPLTSFPPTGYGLWHFWGLIPIFGSWLLGLDERPSRHGRGEESQMKRLVLLVGFVTLATNPATAQRAQNIEFGGFGSWWRFDRSFQIENRFGGGARIGYNLSDRVGLEVTGDFIATRNTAGTQNITVNTVSGSVVLNFPMSDKLTLLASGGYSRMVFGPDPPYAFTQHMVNGGLGFRMFIARHVALRGDVRAQYRPDNPF